MSDTLDITDFKEQGQLLKVAIALAVKDTQSLVVQPFPSIIKMTKAQFDMLQPDPEMLGTYDSKEHLYLTPLNCMEVRVKT